MLTKSHSSAKTISPSLSLHHLAAAYLFIFTVWGFFRLLFRLPEELEELVLKPLIWLSPVIYILYIEKKSLPSIGWTIHRLRSALAWGLGLGVLFAAEGFLVNYLKFGHIAPPLSISPQSFYFLIVLSLVTAVSEETVFRGFFFSRLLEIGKSEILANITTSVSWTIIYLPIAIFIKHYDLPQLSIFLFLVFIFGIGSAFVYARCKNIAAPILLHLLWSLPIVIFS